jgi:2-polyprenyl-3-methyl-5-hydroxy-6-metoxy-1,4-benzoquinol methylase
MTSRQATLVETVEVKVCYLCGADGESLYAGQRDRLFGVPGLWDVQRCSRCGLVWLHPRPLPKETHKLYHRYHTHVTPPKIRSDARQSLGRLTRGSALRRFWGYEYPLRGSCPRRVMAEVLALLGPIRDAAGGSVMWLASAERGQLLDVGSGNGAFLAEMKRLGWYVNGVEPDPVAANTARTQYGLNITTARLEEASLPHRGFDAVTASHVLEHVHDPIGFLTECRMLLKRGGVIVVVTPNSRSLARRWFGRSWRGWEVPRHLFVFDRETLRTCAERAGFEVQEIRTTARSARDTWCSSRARLTPSTWQSANAWQRFLAAIFWFVEHVTSRAIPWGEEVVLRGRRS